MRALTVLLLLLLFILSSAFASNTPKNSNQNDELTIEDALAVIVNRYICDKIDQYERNPGEILGDFFELDRYYKEKELLEKIERNTRKR